MNNNLLLLIAKRELRRGREDRDITVTLNQADALQLCQYAEGQCASDVLEVAKRENAIEAKAARKFALETLYAYRSKDQAEIVEALVVEVLKKNPTWDRAYASKIVVAANADLRAAFQLVPIRRLSADYRTWPACEICYTEKTQDSYVCLTDMEIKSMCFRCAEKQLPRLEAARA